MTPYERLQLIQLTELPAAERRVRETCEAYTWAKAFKDGLRDELRELSQILHDDETGAPSAA
jgi:hypothetical protein